MGRYFQHAPWPNDDFVLAGGLANVAQSPITFHSSGGVHFIYAALLLQNTGATTDQLRALITLDGASAGEGLDRTHTFPPSREASLILAGLLEIPAGPHILAVQASGPGAGDSVRAGTGILLAIEFPSWESSDRIEGP